MRLTKHRISDLGRIVTGKTPRTTNHDFWDGEIPFITPEDLRKGKTIYDTARHITNEGAKSVNSSIIPAGSVCVSCIGNLGYVALTRTSSVTNQQINSIIPSANHSPDFLYYKLKSIWNYFKLREGNATTVPILNKSALSDIIVDLPDLPTQLRIAGVMVCSCHSDASVSFSPPNTWFKVLVVFAGHGA